MRRNENGLLQVTVLGITFTFTGKIFSSGTQPVPIDDLTQNCSYHLHPLLWTAHTEHFENEALPANLACLYAELAEINANLDKTWWCW